MPLKLRLKATHLNKLKRNLNEIKQLSCAILWLRMLDHNKTNGRPSVGSRNVVSKEDDDDSMDCAHRKWGGFEKSGNGKRYL